MFAEAIMFVCLFLIAVGFGFSVWNAKAFENFIKLCEGEFQKVYGRLNSIESIETDNSWCDQVDVDVASLKESHKNLSDWCEVWKTEIEFLKNIQLKRTKELQELQEWKDAFESVQKSHKEQIANIYKLIVDLGEDLGNHILNDHPKDVVTRHEFDLDSKDGIEGILKVIIAAAQNGVLSVNPNKPCDGGGCGRKTKVTGNG